MWVNSQFNIYMLVYAYSVQISLQSVSITSLISQTLLFNCTGYNYSSVAKITAGKTIYIMDLLIIAVKPRYNLTGENTYL